jgi:hypothetical protein
MATAARETHRERIRAPFGVIGTAPDLLNGEDDITEAMEAIEVFQVAAELPIRLIIIDTLHSCAPGSKEDAGDTGAILTRVRMLVEKFGCAVAIVHHAGKDSARGARGSNSLEAAADVIIEVVDEGKIRTPVIRKLRDGDPPALEPFVIDSVIFGQGTADAVRVGVHELTEPKLDPNDPRKVKAAAMRKDGASYEAIAKALGVGKTTVWEWLNG